MVILIAGVTHTGKTVLAQKLLEKYHFPYLSIDHLKMGLIRSNQTSLTVTDDNELTPYLWNILKEMIKTAIENNQNLIIEGCYIPFNFQDYFTSEYIQNIKFYCLIMSENYINANFEDILLYANKIEHRLDDSCCSKENLLFENKHNLTQCQKYNLNYILIDKNYDIKIEL